MTNSFLLYGSSDSTHRHILNLYSYFAVVYRAISCFRFPHEQHLFLYVFEQMQIAPLNTIIQKIGTNVKSGASKNAARAGGPGFGVKEGGALKMKDRKNDFGGLPRWAFWAWLEKNHPAVYEVVWASILAVSLASIIISGIVLAVK